MNIYDIAIARALSSGGGGGGSSDFTTAEVTLSDSRINCSIAFCMDFPPEYGLPIPGTVMIIPSGFPSSDIVKVPLYKGGAVAIFTTNNGTISTSGDIMTMGNDMYLITGDCTVSIS